MNLWRSRLDHPAPPPMERPSIRTIGALVALALVGGVLALGCSSTRPVGEAPRSQAPDTIDRPLRLHVTAEEVGFDSVGLDRLPLATVRTPRLDSFRRARRRVQVPRRARRRPRTGADTLSGNRAFVDADSLAAFTRNNEQIQELMGDVFVRQDSTRLRSERALRYLERDETVFTERVRIVERGDTLWADSVRYDQRRKIGYARGTVRMTDGDVTVLAPRADYYNREKRAVFPDTVTLVDSTRTLRASAGEYFSDADRAEFYGHVRLNDAETVVEADSLTYFREDSVSVARGNVFIERRAAPRSSESTDQGERTYLFGDHARMEETRGFSRVDGHALLLQVRTDSTGTPSDTLMASARRMVATRSDTLRRLVAVDSVRIWQSDIAAAADSTVYDRIPPPDTADADVPPYEETRLYQGPITWFEQTQVTGDTIRVVVRNRSIDSVYVQSSAFAAQLDTASQRIQQLKGRSMTASFRNDSLRRLVAKPNAQTIFFRTNDQGALTGAGQTSGDRIVMDFWNGNLKKARVYSGIQIRSWKAENIPENLRLDGLRWQPQRRPTKDEFLRQRRVWEHLPEFGRPPALARRDDPPDTTAPPQPPAPYDTLQAIPTVPPDTTRAASPTNEESGAGSGRSSGENGSEIRQRPLDP